MKIKVGKHGTMYLYDLRLRWQDPGQTDDTSSYWGYSEEHAIDKLLTELSNYFYSESELPRILSVSRRIA